MKIHVQKTKGKEEFIIDVPASIDFMHLAKGEYFSLYIQNNLGQFIEEKCTFLADGRSILIGNKIVRVNNNFIEKKGEHYRFGIKSNNYIQQKNYLANVIKPVQSRTNLTNILGGELKSPMTGKIVSVLVSEQSVVKEGDALVIIEAMKMENRIVAECDGTISKIKISKGNSVSVGDFLLYLSPTNQG
ncbi:acetyl-CoA carboxylase biotin carboxyl carrier protein subunit [Pigmentibacter sp. JX0631]|uniref:acetyl-CoA carboxylase biotin carboxyl carrier protein subunit n=1 Tax=Pigmentibacter sp. JX0631 TaxID=2976982 RepID=UPI002468D2E2|nr:acetyl-CoA carboxylase biotin carboxyl carrier protein subunit [Pigmentibacter sp. JX0631]WGL60993.1 acetyl-CoA carboxylase biotin carboxyl carrier protein subunit [Pigmentibacter sp. JX0631]